MFFEQLDRVQQQMLKDAAEEFTEAAKAAAEAGVDADLSKALAMLALRDHMDDHQIGYPGAEQLARLEYLMIGKLCPYYWFNEGRSNFYWFGELSIAEGSGPECSNVPEEVFEFMLDHCADVDPSKREQRKRAKGLLPPIAKYEPGMVSFTSMLDSLCALLDGLTPDLLLAPTTPARRKEIVSHLRSERRRKELEAKAKK